jgi:Iap family predicted aminopeptidase
MVSLVQGCAEELGVEPHRGFLFRNATDGLIPLKAGYPTATLGSVNELNVPSNYHWPTDTPENVDYGTLADAARLCEAVGRKLATASRSS